MKEILLSTVLASKIHTGIMLSNKEVERILTPPPPLYVYERKDPDSYWYKLIIQNSVVPTIQVLAQREIRSYLAGQVHMDYGDVVDELKVKRTLFYVYKW